MARGITSTPSVKPSAKSKQASIDWSFFRTTASYLFKDNVETLVEALDKVKKLRGVSYTRNDIEDKTTKVGLIAQEVKEVLPEVVSIDKEEKYSVAYGNIVGLLIEAIKEQQKQIEELKSNIEESK